MTEIFISYSRRDKEFVLRFLDALKNNGYSSETIWVDWEDIPPSSKWEDEIRKGIQETNSVIFVLSPEWAKSNECAKELAVAAQYNKRLFPVVWQNVDPNTIQKELASLNWIFFREADNFDEAMQKLLAALKTDLEYVSQHTNLTRQALDWENRGRDKEYLLRGKELQEAEAWLAHAENKQPRPSTLQNEFIYDSRQEETRRQQEEFERQRRNFIRVRAALVVAVVLAIAAAVSWISALRQSQKALTSELAAQAISLVDTQPDVALLLSVEANHIGDILNESDPAVVGSLVTALNSSPRLSEYLHGHAADVRAVAFSPDGRWLATAGGKPSSKTGEVYLWDMGTYPLKPQKLNVGETDRLLGVAFSADSQTLVAAGDGGKLFVWDVNACCDLAHTWDVPERVRAIRFMEVNGREYLAAGIQGEVTFWDVATGKQQVDLTLTVKPTFTPPSGVTIRVLGLGVSADGKQLAAGSEDGYVTVWELVQAENSTDEMFKEKFHSCSFAYDVNEPLCDEYDETVSKEVRGLSFSADGSLLVTGSTDQYAWLWDAETGDFLARTPDASGSGHINAVTGVMFDPRNDRRVATVSWDNTVRLWDLVDNGERWVFNHVETMGGHSNSIWGVAYSPNGIWLASASSDYSVILWDMDQVNQIGAQVGGNMAGEMWGLAVSPAGDRFAAADVDGTIQVWDVHDTGLDQSLTLNHPQGVLALTFSNDGKQLVSAGYDNTIRAWDLASGREMWSIEDAHGKEQIWAVAFTQDGNILASAGYDKKVKLWDTATQSMIAEMNHDRSVYALTFNEDDTELFVAGFDSKIYHWDLTDPKSPAPLGSLQKHIYSVNSLSFNNRYPPLMASTSDDKTLLLWNTRNGENAPPVLGLIESMEAVTFRPSGDWLASATNNSTVLLWQLVDPEGCSRNWKKDNCKPSLLGTPLVGHQSAVNNVVFLSDTALISSSDDGQLILWDLNKLDWYDRACEIVQRPLSEAEYSQYIGSKAKPWFLNLLSFFSGTDDVAPACLRN